MSWNDSVQRNKFNKEQKTQEDSYRKKGMSDMQINAMKEFDQAEYKSDRRFFSHTIPLDDNERFTVNEFDENAHSRYWWIEEIDDPVLACRIKTLSHVEIEILTMFVYEGYTQSDIGRRLGISQQAVAKRIKRIKKDLR